MKNLLGEAGKVVAIDSSVSHGNRELAVYLAELCREVGLQAALLEGEEPNFVNLIATPTGDLEHTYELMLLTHLETPDPGSYSLWRRTEHNPFRLSIYGDEMYGLGVANAKLDFLCKLQAISNVGVKRLAQPVALVGSYGEFQGQRGMLRLIRRQQLKARRCLIGAPTELKLADGGLGQARLEIVIPFSDAEKNYKAQHDLAETSSSQSRIFKPEPDQPNPVVGMLEALTKLPESIAVLELGTGRSGGEIPESAYMEIDLTGQQKTSLLSRVRAILDIAKDLEQEFKNHRAPEFKPPHARLILTQVESFQDHLKLWCTCYFPPVVTPEVYEGWIERLRRTCLDNSAQFSLTELKHPFNSANASDFLAYCSGLLSGILGAAEVTKMPMPTAANLLGRRQVECVVFGAGALPKDSQKADEMVRMSELKTAVQFYQSVLEGEIG